MKNKRISAGVRRYHRKRKNSLRIKIALCWLFILIGVGTATCAVAYRLQADRIIQNTVSIELTKCENGKWATDCSLVDIRDDKTVELIKVRQPEKIDKKEWVFNEVRKAGLSVEEVDCLIHHESSWNEWAYNLNKNGSTDFGLWMINSIHKNTISVEDRWDYKKATKWSIAKRLRDGNWNAWYGFVNNCK